MRLIVLLAAFLAGAAGLAHETLLIGASGACLGYASSAALGLATFLAAWALGAWCAARRAELRSRGFVVLGVAQAAAGVVGTMLVLGAGGAAVSRALAAATAIGAIGCVAFLQGFFLPGLAGLEARARRTTGKDFGTLFGANLFGAAFGAHLIAGELVGAGGRLPAAVAASVLALAAALLAARIARSLPPGPPGAPSSTPSDAVMAGELSLPVAGAILGLATAWIATNEWIALRLCALWLGGMELALRSALVAALTALGLGACVLPRILPRGRNGVLAALLLAAASSIWPMELAHFVDVRAVPTDALGAFGVAFAITGPPLFALGGVVPLVHRALTRPDGAMLGRLLFHEAWGAGLGIPLVHFVLAPRVGLAGAAAFGVALGVLAALVATIGAPRAWRFAAPMFVLGALASGWLLAAPPLSGSAPAYRDPALRLLSLVEDQEFAVAVVDDGMRGERTLFTDGFRAAGTGREYAYMQVLGHLPLLLHRHPERVAVLALGTGTTLGAVAMHPEASAIDVLEIAPAVVAAAPYFESKNGGVLAREPERVRVLLGDGRRALADRPSTYDVITMEPLLPDSPFGVYLYTREFYAHARRALRADGLLCQWVPPHALEPRTFEAVVATFGAAFPWSAVFLAGTQVVLVGAEREPVLSPERFPSAGLLYDRLAALGLARPAGLAARYVGPAREGAFATAEPLADGHPWIVYAPRRAGAVLLGDLPANLARLEAARARLPAAWVAVVGPSGVELRDAVRELHRARRAHAIDEARQRGLALTAERVELERARRIARGDPEFAEFDAEVEFLAVIRRGVMDLASGAAADAQLALERASALRPERADVALYLAVARERGADPDAAASLDRAAALCPRIAETAEGRRARTLGLSDGAWSRLVEIAKAAAPR